MASSGPPSERVEVRKHMRRDEDDDDDDDHEDAGDGDDDGPIKPQKKHFRTRAHSNVLNANDFWYPANPAAVPLADYYPGLVDSSGKPPPIEFVDIGCGYGSLLIELAAIFPTAPMLGIEIRPKVVEYVQRRAIALRHAARRAAASSSNADGATATAAAPEAAAAPAAAAAEPPEPPCENVWAVHNNAMRFLPNFFEGGQLHKLFFCFADPHFKRKNHRKRIVSTALLSEYAYVLRPAGLAYVITDVADLMTWLVGHFSSTPLFERLSNEELKADPAVPALIRTDEGLKVTRNNGNMYIAVFRKRIDPLAPQPPSPPNDLAHAADAAADAGYRPQAGGERRGMTW